MSENQLTLPFMRLILPQSRISSSGMPSISAWQPLFDAHPTVSSQRSFFSISLLYAQPARISGFGGGWEVKQFWFLRHSLSACMLHSKVLVLGKCESFFRSRLFKMRNNLHPCHVHSCFYQLSGADFQVNIYWKVVNKSIYFFKDLMRFFLTLNIFCLYSVWHIHVSGVRELALWPPGNLQM